MVKLFEITADYRPNNPNKPVYYVLADCKKEAKKRFNNIISWLKVYSIIEIDEVVAENILNNPMKHIII